MLNVRDAGDTPTVPLPAAPAVAPLLRRRRRALVALVAGATVVAAGGLAAATRIKSPAQVAAEARPPGFTTLTATVERTVIKSTVVVRGTVTAEHRMEVTPVSAQGAQSLVLTGIRKRAGSSVRPGEVLLEVSGRPLFALRGDIPAYRDLKPGLRGRDIAQLRRALEALGFSTAGDADGHFGAATKQAVRALYDRLGYEPADTAGPGGEDPELVAARDAVVQAERRVEELRARPARDAETERQLRYAQEDLATARDRLADVTERSGPMVPLAEVVFVPAATARVVTVNGRVGEPVRSPLATLAAGALVVEGQLDPADSGLVRAGMAVVVEAEAAGDRVPGRVTSVGAQVDATAAQPAGGGQPGQPGAQPGATAGTYLPVLVTPEKPLGPALLGQNVRLTVEAARSRGPVLAVPQAAVTAAADGGTYVTKVVGGRRERVRVDAGLSGGGYVEVTPVAGTLRAGDEVVTGE